MLALTTSHHAKKAKVAALVLAGWPQTELETAVSGGSRELFIVNRCEPELEHFVLNRKRHEPEPDLFFNPFLILDPDEGFVN